MGPEREEDPTAPLLSTIFVQPGWGVTFSKTPVHNSFARNCGIEGGGLHKTGAISEIRPSMDAEAEEEAAGLRRTEQSSV